MESSSSEVVVKIEYERDNPNNKPSEGQYSNSTVNNGYLKIENHNVKCEKGDKSSTCSNQFKEVTVKIEFDPISPNDQSRGKCVSTYNAFTARDLSKIKCDTEYKEVEFDDKNSSFSSLLEPNCIVETTMETDNDENIELMESTDYACSLCEHKFSSQHGLEIHLSQRHFRGKMRLFQCDKCPFVAHQRFWLKQHLQLKHSLRKQYKCDICGSLFSWLKSLKRHSELHTDTGSLRCGRCGKRFSDKPGLKEHTAKSSCSNKFKCDYCDKTFSRTQELKFHRQLHTDGVVLKCGWCRKQFPNRKSLEEHKATPHESFTCDKCSFQTYHRRNLLRHCRRNLH